MDVAYLEYVLKKKGISRAQLTQEMGWSKSTATRRFRSEQKWTAPEINHLLTIGFTDRDVFRIFFNQSAS